MIPIDEVDEETNARALRVKDRCNYRVVGYVMEHSLPKRRAVVVDDTIRWFTTMPDFYRMMGNKKHSEGPGIPDEGWGEDEIPKVDASTPTAVSTPSRPILTAPPTSNLVSGAEEAMCALAISLGCVWNEIIPHNTGWFVPGKPTAYASAFDALHALYEHLEGGGKVYHTLTEENPTVEVISESVEPIIALIPTPDEPKAKPVDPRQEALF
jgi:hypothetical protein